MLTISSVIKMLKTRRDYDYRYVIFKLVLPVNNYKNTFTIVSTKLNSKCQLYKLSMWYEHLLEKISINIGNLC